MPLTRRQFLATGAALATLPSAARAAPSRTLTARAGEAALLPAGYGATPIWGFEGTAPGPVLRFRKGERLERRFVNALDLPSTVHWHGLRLPNAMDGVAGITQDSVRPGGSFDYAFDLRDAGTFWYHPHDRSYEQVGRGLAGALVVEEANPPEVDSDEVLVIQDWRLHETGEMADDFGAMHDWAHNGRLGNWLTANGGPSQPREMPQNARLRLRLVNAATARVLQIVTEGLAGWVVALDGQPLDAPEVLSETLLLGPGARADLIVDVVAAPGGFAALGHALQEEIAPLLTLEVTDPERAAPLPAPEPLPANDWPALGPLDTARRVELRMEGGAMGGLRQASMDGTERPLGELAQMGRVWAFNGAVDMEDRPLATVSPGETLRVAMVNDTAWPHAMHLHGHHFRTVGRDGALGPLRDTILMLPKERAEIAFVAETPGDWMLHCHMLEHAASGMMTLIRVG